MEIVRHGSVPHVMVCGLPGIGKTVRVCPLVDKIAGQSGKSCILEVNAADSRGIKLCGLQYNQLLERRCPFQPVCSNLSLSRILIQ